MEDNENKDEPFRKTLHGTLDEPKWKKIVYIFFVITILALAAAAIFIFLYVAEDNEYFFSLDGILFNKNQSALLQFPVGKGAKSYLIPNSVIYIGNGSFKSCTPCKPSTFPIW